MLEKVDNVSVYATAELSMGTVLYRAREYTNDDYLKNKEVVAIYEKLNELFPDMQLQLEDVNSDSVMSMISFFLYGEMSKMQELRQSITKTEIMEKPFWGFNEKDCDAPLKNRQKPDELIPQAFVFYMRHLIKNSDNGDAPADRTVFQCV